MLRFRALPSLALVVLGIGCGGGAPSATTPGSGGAADAGGGAVASASTAAATKAPAPGDASERDAKPEAENARAAPPKSTPPVLEVLDTGTAPKRALRYVFKAGVTERAEMDMRMSMSVGADRPTIEMPTVRSLLRLESKEITPEGDLRMAFDTEKVLVLTDVQVGPNVRAALENELGGLVGMQGKARISTRGVASEIEFEVPKTASASVRSQLDSMQDSIRNMYLPFPEEPVGKGAKWQVTWALPVNGARMDVRIGYTLQKLEAGSLDADVETTLSAPPEQTMTLPTLPPDARAVLVSLTGKGVGKASPSLTHLIGTGESRITTSSSVRITLNGQKLDQASRTDMRVTVRPAKAAAKADGAAPPKK